MIYNDVFGNLRIKSEGPQVIQIKKFNTNLPDPVIIDKGDWIDLYASETVTLKKGERKLVKLGVGMILPSGMEGWLLPRSGTAKKFNVILANSKGIIDGGPVGYNGEDDEWMANVIAFEDTTIEAGERFCQFRIALSQKATCEDKFKWLLSDGIEIQFVEHLNDKSRGGFNSTGTDDLTKK